MRLPLNFVGPGKQSLVWLAILSSFLLISCKSAPVKEAAQKPVEPNHQEQTVALEPEQVPEAQPPEEPRLSPAEKARLNLEQKLLAEAEQAFRAGRLTDPSHDNAYDRFQSVIMLNPDSSLARSGVQAILLSYAERIREALNQGQVSNAAYLLRRAEIYYPANSLLMDLKKEVASLRVQEEEEMLVNEPDDNTRMEYPLPEGALSRKSSTVTNYLQRIAERLRETDETIIIYARTDGEGRWIYSQLKKAVPDYRVRGDIKIARSPKISVLPPLQ